MALAPASRAPPWRTARPPDRTGAHPTAPRGPLPRGRGAGALTLALAARASLLASAGLPIGAA